MNKMIGYHLVYKKENFSTTLLACCGALSIHPSETDIKRFVKVIGELYGIVEICDIHIRATESPLNEGVYIGATNEIIFYKQPSLITVLHEVRHFIQKNTDLNNVDLSYEDKELDARAWSSSLFYAVYPEQYIELCNKNLIKYK